MASIPFTKDGIPNVVRDYCKRTASSAQHVEKEIAAYVAICERYEKTKNRRTRQALQNMLDFVLDPEGNGMKLSYVVDDVMGYVIKEEADDQKALYPLAIYEAATEFMTHATYTKGRGKSTAWTVYSGTGYYSNSDATDRTRYENWTAGEIRSSYVKFGSHRFGIALTTERILKMLEERYGLDFKQLEKDRAKKNKADPDVR